MSRIWIKGNRPLFGEAEVQGSKNAALPLMAAAVLNEGITVLHRCPRILDVEYMSAILRELGCRVFWQGEALVIDARGVDQTYVSGRYATKLRASVILLGSLLGRMGKACLPYPGGCTIGKRPIDLHLKALTAMGARETPGEGAICFCATCLRGAEVTFGLPSVGATENAILAAVKAGGTTVLKGCAAEPEIGELCRFLNQAGARISGVGSRELTIEGVEGLKDCEYVLMPDRIVAGTYLLAAAGTRGEITLKGARAEHLEALIQALEQAGARIAAGEERIRMDAREAHGNLELVSTGPYPGFPTDLQSQMMAFLCRAQGESRIEENLFESRFLTAQELTRMGADITITEKQAKIHGVKELWGANVKARELRGGAALVIAGLMAEGETVADGYEFIQRGYEDIARDFRMLGGEVHVLSD